MSLADAIAAERPRIKGPKCAFAAILGPNSPLDPDDQATLRAALADESIQGTQIARALATMQVQVAPHTVRRHRSGECRCET